MDKRLLEFVHALRKSGLKISTGELADCLQALKAYGINDRDLFYRILRATLLKSETDAPVFDMAFRIYFRDQVEKPRELAEKKCCDGMGTGVDGSGTGKAGMGAASQQLYQGIREKKMDMLLEMIQLQLTDLSPGEENVDELLHRAKVSMEWFMVENAFEREEDGEESLEVLHALEEYMRRHLEKLIARSKGDQGISELLIEENMREKDFSALNEAQVKEMEKRVSRLANKLASRYSYRLKPAKIGRVDMRRVLKKTARLGRTPQHLLYQDKVLDKPRLVVLCDISGSVGIYSAFLLQLVYAMSRRFADMRTFLFVDEIAEVTEEYKTKDVREAIFLAVKEARCSRLGISNFGQVFETFKNNYGGILTPKTTMIILGDAKNNWYPPRKEELKSLSQRVKRIIWLNPDPIEKWNREDSVIEKYASSCEYVFECRNLDQLEKAFRRIV